MFHSGRGTTNRLIKIHRVTSDVHYVITERSVFEKRKPGIRFTEKMVGTFTPTRKNNNESICELTLTIETNDAERMVSYDPAHAAQISGTVTCPALSTTPLTVSEGKVAKCDTLSTLSACLGSNLVLQQLLSGD